MGAPFPAVKFLHSAELGGATRAALDAPLNEFQTQRHPLHKGAGTNTSPLFAGDTFAFNCIENAFYGSVDRFKCEWFGKA